MAEGSGAEERITVKIIPSTVQKWRMVQVIAILPLIISIVCLFSFKGSMLGMIAFFLILIVGVLLPQIYRDLAETYLSLDQKIEELKKQLPE